MHHLLGGEKAGLTPPSEDKRSTESKWVRTACQRLAQGDRKARDASQHKALRAAGKENGSGSLDLGVPSPDSTVCLDALCSRLKQAVTAPLTARPKRKAVPLGECDSPPQQQAHDPPPLHPPRAADADADADVAAADFTASAESSQPADASAAAAAYAATGSSVRIDASRAAAFAASAAPWPSASRLRSTFSTSAR